MPKRIAWALVAVAMAVAGASAAIGLREDDGRPAGVAAPVTMAQAQPERRPQAVPAPLPADTRPREVPRSDQSVRLSFAPVVREVAPAVVNVYASRVVASRRSPFMDDPFFRRFFGDDPSRGRSDRVQQSLGSGVIVDPSGIIVTNHHVIADADAVKVALADGREVEVDIVLKDERTDLAVLKTREGDDYPFVQFADSDGLEVGDLVLAIGNPFGVGQTVTSGIVSGLARTHVGVSDYQFFIQTDAAINPGNSGGALIDMDGRLVGINTAIYSRSGGSIGIGFAIPSNMVRLVAETGREGGRIQRPWIGARFQAVTPEIAGGLGIDLPRGALVTDVEEDGPAEEAGLVPGDLILSVNGVTVADPSALNYRLATAGIGSEAALTVRRGGEERAISVALAAAPETVPRDERTIAGRSPFAGATVMNLSPAVAEETGYAGGTTEGVLVGSVAARSPASQVGLAAGDVILDVNGTTIDSTRRLEEVAAEPARIWRLAIERGGRVIRTMIGG